MPIKESRNTSDSQNVLSGTPKVCNGCEKYNNCPVQGTVESYALNCIHKTICPMCDGRG